MEIIVKIQLLFVGMMLASTSSNTQPTTNEGQTELALQCQNVNCIEKIDGKNYPLGAELTIRFCANKYMKTHEYRRSEQGWILEKISAKGSAECTEQ